MIYLKRAVATFAICAISGCAATGVKVSDAALNSLKKGEATIQDALEALGQPTARISSGDGTITLIYSYAEASIRPTSFIPVVGLVAGGSDVSTTSATLRFDALGKLIDITRADSQYGTGTGLSAGRTSPSMSKEQPRQP